MTDRCPMIKGLSHISALRTSRRGVRGCVTKEAVWRGEGSRVTPDVAGAGCAHFFRRLEPVVAAFLAFGAAPAAVGGGQCVALVARRAPDPRETRRGAALPPGRRPPGCGSVAGVCRTGQAVPQRRRVGHFVPSLRAGDRTPLRPAWRAWRNRAPSRGGCRSRRRIQHHNRDVVAADDRKKRATNTRYWCSCCEVSRGASAPVQVSSSVGSSARARARLRRASSGLPS